MIKRGEIWYVEESGKEDGSEMKKSRPGLVVSNNVGNDHAPVVTVVWLTTQEKKPLPTHVEVFSNVNSIAICEQVNTVSKDRLSNFVRKLDDFEMAEVDKALSVALGIKGNDEDCVCDDEALRKERIEKEIYKNLYEDLIGKLLK